MHTHSRCGFWKDNPNAALGEAREETIGGIVWQIQEISYNSNSVAVAAADINGQPYVVAMNTDQANESNARAIFADVLSTLRPIS